MVKNVRNKITPIIQENNFTPNNNVDIFICAHCDFNHYPINPIYKIVHGGENINVPLKQYSETSTELTPVQYSLAEGSRMYWLYQNYDFKEYIGICHYRKYFSFFNDVPNIDFIFKTYDIIVAEPITDVKLFEAYKICHNINDLIEMHEIVRYIYPEISNEFVNALNDTKLYPCNMFIMKSKDYIEYCSKIFPLIKEFCKRRSWNTDKDIYQYVLSHKSQYPGEDMKYQARVLGYLLERLTSIYITMKFKNPLTFPITIGEKILSPIYYQRI